MASQAALASWLRRIKRKEGEKTPMFDLSPYQHALR